jgi:hypothetical protein
MLPTMPRAELSERRKYEDVIPQLWWELWRELDGCWVCILRRGEHWRTPAATRQEDSVAQKGNLLLWLFVQEIPCVQLRTLVTIYSSTSMAIFGLIVPFSTLSLLQTQQSDDNENNLEYDSNQITPTSNRPPPLITPSNKDTSSRFPDGGRGINTFLWKPLEQVTACRVKLLRGPSENM